MIVLLDTRILSFADFLNAEVTHSESKTHIASIQSSLFNILFMDSQRVKCESLLIFLGPPLLQFSAEIVICSLFLKLKCSYFT